MLRWSSARPCLLDVLKLVSIPSVPQKAQFPAGGRGKRVISAIVKKTMVKGIVRGALDEGQPAGIRTEIEGLLWAGRNSVPASQLGRVQGAERAAQRVGRC